MKRVMKLGKKMDKHKQDILKWKNGRIEQKLADTYKKMGYIAAMECYSLMLGEYSVELTNGRKLVLVHLIETHDIKTVDGKTGWAVGGDDLDDNYNRYILPPTNGRQLGRPPSKHRESQMQGTKPQRCSKYGEVGHTRRTCRNPHADFEASYEGNVVEVKDLLNGSLLKKLRLHSRVFRNSRTSSSLQHGNDSYIVPNCGIRCGLCSYWVSAMTPPQPLFAL
ncbi:LOW QUALITY PROTEIN: hypothetical protein Cgig2_025597 [Carnegiea gigantea]|uniref:Uncharacterized protein n=1 Tax=Carnegiea gigantea TaxID=171969 RepID=A0A9Q1JQY9_9CARY|nr:LOW QUALITY PROTEIN: hypothetical protein Cgig2_025597 [Carnegiea gigantea]